LSVGASTLMNTMMNIMTPALFAVAPGMIINTLFFVQGIGTTGGQRLVGKYAQNFEAWKMVNAILLILGLVGTLLFILIKFSVPRQKPPEKAEANSFKQVLSNPAFFWLTCILGLYFIAEHGMMNWFMNYAVKQFQFSTDEASVYLALFFGGMTVGRLVFSPLVHRWGMKKSIFIFGGTGSVCYALGAFGGEPTLGVLAFAGILLSIIYPTFVMMIQGYYKDSIVATATGMIISVATVFDILFNAGYGKVVDILGLRYSFLILPAAVLLFFALLSLFFLRERKKTAIIK
ncbi:MAG: MFS transporter, partial [Oscillospiraceae bacterium]